MIKKTECRVCRRGKGKKYQKRRRILKLFFAAQKNKVPRHGKAILSQNLQMIIDKKVTYTFYK